MAKYHTLFPVKSSNITDDSDNILFLTDVNFDQSSNRAVNQGKWYFPFLYLNQKPHVTGREDSKKVVIHLFIIFRGIAQKHEIMYAGSLAGRSNKVAACKEKYCITGNKPQLRQHP